MRLPRDIEPQFALAYLKTFDVEQAALEVGVIRSPRYFGNALLKRPRVRAMVNAEIEARKLRLTIEADFVLAELLRQYARLSSMLGHDMSLLYSDTGAIKPISDWPAVFRERLITEIHSQDTFERSTDGEQAEERQSWDKSGTVTKVKRESTLAIEKEIRATLQMIGQHINVKAFPVAESKGGDLHLHLHAEVTSRLNAALARERRLTDGTP